MATSTSLSGKRWSRFFVPMRPPCYVRREFVEVGRAGVEHASASDWPTAGTVVLKPAFLIRLLMGNNSHRDSLMRGENALRAIVLCFVVCYTDGVIPTTMGGYADGLLLLLLLLFYYYFFFNIYSLFVFHLFRSCLLFGRFCYLCIYLVLSSSFCLVAQNVVLLWLSSLFLCPIYHCRINRMGWYTVFSLTKVPICHLNPLISFAVKCKMNNNKIILSIYLFSTSTFYYLKKICVDLKKKMFALI